MLYFFLSVESVESVQSASKVGKGDFVEAGAEGETQFEKANYLRDALLGGVIGFLSGMHRRRRVTVRGSQHGHAFLQQAHEPPKEAVPGCMGGGDTEHRAFFLLARFARA